MLSLSAVNNMRLVLRKNGSPKQYTLSPGPLMRPPPGSPSAVGGALKISNTPTQDTYV